jgi:hypothetical protein
LSKISRLVRRFGFMVSFSSGTAASIRRARSVQSDKSDSGESLTIAKKQQEVRADCTRKRLLTKSMGHTLSGLLSDRVTLGDDPVAGSTR